METSSPWYNEIYKNNPDARDDKLFQRNHHDDLLLYLNNPESVSFYQELNQNNPIDEEHDLSFKWFMLSIN